MEDFVAQLKRPRRIMLMVKAGQVRYQFSMQRSNLNSLKSYSIPIQLQAVDDFINKLLPLLSKGDIIIDGGNSEHQDSTRR